MTDENAGRPRDVWLLTDDRPGNRTQALGVARALGRPTVEKPLVFDERARKTTGAGRALAALDDASRAAIAPPWPDLVIAAGKRAAPIARHVGEASGGSTRIVLVGRRSPGDGADLVIRADYFQQAPSPNLLTVALPPTKVDAATLALVRSRAPDPFAGMSRPVCCCLVGGETGRHAFEPDFAERMAREVAAAAKAAGASLALVTSRRTGEAAIAALRRGAPDAPIHAWRADAEPDDFLALLSWADLVAVTGESESMLSEAVASGKPLTIYPLPARPETPILRLRAAVARIATTDGALAPLASRIMNAGIVAPRRDLARLHEMIEGRGWGRVFDGALVVGRPAPFAEDERIKSRIEALF